MELFCKGNYFEKEKKGFIGELYLKYMLMLIWKSFRLRAFLFELKILMQKSLVRFSDSYSQTMRTSNRTMYRVSKKAAYMVI